MPVVAGCHAIVPAGPVGSAGPLREVAASRAAGLPGTFVNSSSRPMRMYLVGRNDKGTWVALTADGRLTLLGSAPAPGVPIPIGSKNITIPYLSSARAYFVAKPGKLSIALSGGGPAWPREWVKGDPSFTLLSDWFEYTYASAGSTFYVNATQVNIFGLPFTLKLQPKASNGPPVASVGFANGARTKIFAAMQALPDYKNLIVSKKNSELRIVNPGYAIEYQGASFPSNYLDPYIDKVWKYYETHTMTLDTMLSASGPYYRGSVSGAKFTFEPMSGTGPTVVIDKPSTQDAFNCANSLGQPGEVPGRISAQICAGVNRGTLLVAPSKQPDYNEADFYKVVPTNLYSKVIHQYALHGLAYGFADDDQGSFSSTLANTKPTKFTVTITKF